MDKATKRARARSNAQRTKRGELSNFEPRGLGKKNKPSVTFPARQCDEVWGYETVAIRRKRKDNTEYLLVLKVGGIRCPKDATVGNKCLQHLAPQESQENKKGRARSKRKAAYVG
jgi:hypothetical protein